MPFSNLPQMFFARAADLSTRPRYRYRAGDTWREVTWAEMEARVRAKAAGGTASVVIPLAGTRPRSPMARPHRCRGQKRWRIAQSAR